MAETSGHVSQIGRTMNNGRGWKDGRGRRYVLCLLCGKVWKTIYYLADTPVHCGEKVRWIKDAEAIERRKTPTR